MAAFTIMIKTIITPSPQILSTAIRDSYAKIKVIGCKQLTCAHTLAYGSNVLVDAWAGHMFTCNVALHLFLSRLGMMSCIVVLNMKGRLVVVCDNIVLVKILPGALLLILFCCVM
jgi:hypothetical protein